MVAQWERICLQCRRCGFYPWIRKIPWRRKWQPIPLFLPGKFYGQRSLVGYSLWRYKESNYNWDARTHFTSKLDQKCGEAWVSGLTVLHLAQWHAPPVAVQSLRCVQFFETPWTAAHQASLYFTISWSLPKLRCIESAMPSNHLILCCSLLLLPSIFPSIRVFSNESAFNMRWPKYWSFNFRILSFNVYSGLIHFRIDWFELLSIQETLKSLLQHHNL